MALRHDHNFCLPMFLVVVLNSPSFLRSRLPFDWLLSKDGTWNGIRICR
jgi:hypothetical protein